MAGLFFCAASKMAKREKIDWEKGDKLIRLGQLTLTEIAKQLGCPTSTVSRRVKSRGIVRDKTDEVRTRTKAALISNPATQSATQQPVAEVDDQDIDDAVKANVALVLSHRQDIQRLAAVEQRLLSELGDEESPPTKLYVAQYKGEVVKEVIGLTVTEKTTALGNLATVMHRRIQLERQAFGIDDTDREKPGDNLVVLSEQEAAL